MHLLVCELFFVYEICLGEMLSYTLRLDSSQNVTTYLRRLPKLSFILSAFYLCENYFASNESFNLQFENNIVGPEVIAYQP